MLEHQSPVSSLLCDTYQLSMMQSYIDARMDRPAVFEFFVRNLPEKRAFLIAAGLESVLEFLERCAFTENEIRWLAEAGRFSHSFLDFLRGFRFTGDVDALPEGTVCFEQEPLIRVVAPISQAQLIESRLINLVHYQTLIASKAIRSRIACERAGQSIQLVEFGMRRAHGAEAALLASRASYLAGYDATSNLLGGRAFGIPISGTVAHSYIEAHESELQAFEHFSESQREDVTLLLDTYDTESAAELVVNLVPKLKEKGIRISSVRLDSGDLAQHARKVRAILDRSGPSPIRIFASGGLDENEIEALLLSGAPIDGFGVGTKLTTSSDAPYLDCAYKLVEYAGMARRKVSEEKKTWPGRKQVFRYYGPDDLFTYDVLALNSENLPGGKPLLEPAMRNGKRLSSAPSLASLRNRARNEVEHLPPELTALSPQARYSVKISDELTALAEETNHRRKAA